MYTKRFRRAFTLAELLVVIAIIGVLVAIVIPIFSASQERAQGAVCASNRRNLLSSYVIRYLNSNTSNADYDDLFPDALHDVSNADVTFTGVDGHYTVKNFCPSGGTVTVICKAQGGIVITCDKHPDSDDKTGATIQANDFISFMNQWLKDNNCSFTDKNKNKLYADYYALYPEAVPVTDSFKQQLVDAGLNKTLKDSDLYWWSYPVTDSDGSVLYTVTFANKQSNSAYWTDSDSNIRGKMNGGYVVIVNGTTYVRSNSGGTVEVANSNNKYKSEAELEAALISNGYFPLS